MQRRGDQRLMVRFRTLASSLKRAEELRDMAIDINDDPKFGGGYVALAPNALPQVFLQFKTQAMFQQWYRWALATKL